MPQEPRLCFVIAHKWIRKNPPFRSYLSYYIDNIKRLYPDALTLVVDNNSLHKEDVLKDVSHLSGVVVLDNKTDSGFEVGAYTVACRWLCGNGRFKDFDFLIFTQDTFVLKNKYDFTVLWREGIKSCPINTWNNDMWRVDLQEKALAPMGLNDNLDRIGFCWCNGFVAEGNKIPELLSYIDKVKISTKDESCAAERWLARVVYELNEKGKHWDIDGNLDHKRRKYNEWTVDVMSDVPSYFVKSIQQKTEYTVDCD